MVTSLFIRRDGRLIQYKNKGGDVQRVFALEPPCKIEQYHPEKKTFAFQLTTSSRSITLKAESEREMHGMYFLLPSLPERLVKHAIKA